MAVFSADLIVASGEASADMRYVTRLGLPDPFLYIGMPELKLAIVSDLEYDRAKLMAAPEITVINLSELGGGKVLNLLKAVMQKYQIGEFRVPYDFPCGLAVQMKEAGIPMQVSLKNFFPQRIQKSEYEIECLRKALKVTEHSMQAAFDALAAASIGKDDQLFYQGEPLTSERLRGIIDSDLAAHDACGAGTIAAGGKQGAMPHNHGEGALYAHQPIVIDIFPRLNGCGYYGDLTRTVVKGEAPETVRRAFYAVRTVRDECKAMLRVGMMGKIPHEHAVQRLAELGFPTGNGPQGFYGFFHGLGHGVGLELHEEPRLSVNVKHLLASGEVVTVEPGVYYPEWGGMRLEDMVVMQNECAECLTSIATELEIP